MLSGSRECQKPRQGALDFRNMLYFPLTSPDTYIYGTVLYFLENVTISGSITLEEQYRKEGKLHLSTLISSSFLVNIDAKPLWPFDQWPSISDYAYPSATLNQSLLGNYAIKNCK